MLYPVKEIPNSLGYLCVKQKKKQPKEKSFPFFLCSGKMKRTEGCLSECFRPKQKVFFLHIKFYFTLEKLTCHLILFDDG
jgi:hypothetical protein